MSEVELRHEPDRNRFVASIEGATARVEYREVGNETLDYRSTWVPPELRGEGVGETVVVQALEWAREHGKRVVPSCPFVERVIRDHPEYRDIVADEEPRSG